MRLGWATSMQLFSDRSCGNERRTCCTVRVPVEEAWQSLGSKRRSISTLETGHFKAYSSFSSFRHREDLW